MNHAEMQFLNTDFPYKKQYGNFIGGQWVKPLGGEYFDNISPITGEAFTSSMSRCSDRTWRRTSSASAPPAPARSARSTTRGSRCSLKAGRTYSSGGWRAF